MPYVSARAMPKVSSSILKECKVQIFVSKLYKNTSNNELLILLLVIHACKIPKTKNDSHKK